MTGLSAITTGAPAVRAGGPTENAASIAYYTKATDNLLNKPEDLQFSSGAFFLGYRSSTSWYLTADSPQRA
ncbi:MAG: hypothetical protein ACYCUG_05675 [Acidimicrobiales bacterium]